MFTKRRRRGFLSFFLAVCLLLPLSSCEKLPPEAVSALKEVPTLLTQAADWLDELALNLSNYLERRQTLPPPEVPEESSFAVHFIDVGQADCALVACDGAYMLIDGGNAEDSDLVYSYLKSNGITHLDYMVATHTHEDHIGGLSGAAYAATVGAALSPVAEGNTKVFQNLVKSLANQGVELTVPAAGDTFDLGSARVEVLGPLKDYDETNDTSIVLSVDYGETAFLFTGDMESAAETDLVEAGTDLAATVLKVGHHGSSSSTSYRFLREVMPSYAVISVGKDNSYGHPTQAVLSRLEDAEVQVFRTDLHGTIIAQSDGRSVTFQTERSPH